MLLKFFLKTAAFVVLIFGSCFLIQAFIAPRIRDTNAYVGATIDKEKRLAEMPSPRVIFVGGSNLTLGLDSKRISDSIHLPVVNMSLHAGLGVVFALNEVKEHLKKGDKVVLSIEYGLTKKGDTKLYTQLMDINPDAARYLDNTLNDKLRLMDINWQRCVSSLFLDVAGNAPQNIYRRDGFTKEGDMIGHLSLPQPANQTDRGKMVFKDYKEVIRAFNAFIDVANQKGAQVYYTFPTYMASEYQLNKAVIGQYQAQFQQELTCPIINTPESFVFPDTDYFDTAYHLNKVGRDKRTVVMIDLLQRNVCDNHDYTPSVFLAK